jgi:hypothetical protein
VWIHKFSTVCFQGFSSISEEVFLNKISLLAFVGSSCRAFKDFHMERILKIRRMKEEIL